MNSNASAPLDDEVWKQILADPKLAADVLSDPQTLARFLSRVRELESSHLELQLLHEFTLEHSNEIEDQLAEKVDEVQALVLDLEVRNGFIREVFGRYMTDEVVKTLLGSPDALKLGGEKRTITILMSDLRGFSALCEQLPPEQVVRTLNTYLAAMAEVITSFHGTINDFIGDAILAIFGAPLPREDDEERAIACAVAMQRAMVGVNDTLQTYGLPRLEMGIGVHTGEVVLGNIGSHKRAKYGVIGSPVNLASRIESYTVGGQVLVSQQTIKRFSERVVTGESFHASPKGIDTPLQILEVRGIRGEYDLDLPVFAPDLRPLVQPQDVEMALIDGKHVGGHRLPAKLIALAPDAATVVGTGEIAPRTDVKMTPLVGAAAGTAIYGKIVSATPGRATIRFTAVPPEAQAWIQALRQAPST